MGTLTVATIIAIGLAARWIIDAFKGGASGYELAARDAQIQRLREELDTVHAEVRRLSEEQSFMVRLLEQGGATPAGGARSALPPPEGPNPETR